jgi:PLP dependent protein
MIAVAERLAQVQARIRAAELRFGRPAGSVQLLAVSKTQPAAALRAAYASGQAAFGENYVQEALAKQAQLADLKLQWHFIGPIQANKTKYIAEHFDWVHSVDRIKLLDRLNDQRPEAAPALNICLQVNIDNEPTKAGAAPLQLRELAAAAVCRPRLRLRGLMAIPAPRSTFAEQCHAFAAVRELARTLPVPELDTLSMGMSDDLEAAVAEGATIVRIGSAVFGARPPD